LIGDVVMREPGECQMANAQSGVTVPRKLSAATGNNPFDPSLFKPETISAETLAANEKFRKATSAAPNWWEIGAAATRAAAASGKGAFPRPEKSARARTIHIDGKGGHKVALRLIVPPQAVGVYLFMHGGGMVFGSSEAQDPMLERIVANTGMACVSLEYRLAPENPYPAAWDDCESAAAWLLENAKSEFGSDALTIGGESAGATLAVATLLRLRDRHGTTGFRAANLAYGNYDASMTPSQSRAPDKGDPVALVGKTSLQKYVEAYLPAGTDPRDPDVSPLYAGLNNMPPALLSVGTFDPLLDDSLFLYARWIAAGNEAELAIYPGAPHAFNSLPMPFRLVADARIDAFLKRAIS
jgi:acetyl esterase